MKGEFPFSHMEVDMKALMTAAITGLVLAGPASAQTTVVTVPGEVRTYITEQEVPSVVYDGDIIGRWHLSSQYSA